MLAHHNSVIEDSEEYNTDNTVQKKQYTKVQVAVGADELSRGIGKGGFLERVENKQWDETLNK